MGPDQERARGKGRGVCEATRRLEVETSGHGGVEALARGAGVVEGQEHQVELRVCESAGRVEESRGEGQRAGRPAIEQGPSRSAEAVGGVQKPGREDEEDGEAGRGHQAAAPQEERRAHEGQRRAHEAGGGAAEEPRRARGAARGVEEAAVAGESRSKRRERCHESGAGGRRRRQEAAGGPAGRRGRPCEGRAHGGGRRRCTAR
mmetsp:Transcript_89667/g.249339  ORF Transcript_89667/g.249339 Transcript_89667/m.249339 type:complete len:204 (+) Transcript_89667:346-957(+)